MVGVDITLEAHLKLQSTPFHHFVRASIVVINLYLLDDLIRRYQGNGKFVIRGKELTCTVDLGRILGLPFTRESMNMNLRDYKNNFYDEHLHSCSMTWFSIAINMRAYSEKDVRSADHHGNLVRIILTHLFAGFLFMNSSHTIRKLLRSSQGKRRWRPTSSCVHVWVFDRIICMGIGTQSFPCLDIRNDSMFISIGWTSGRSDIHCCINYHQKMFRRRL